MSTSVTYISGIEQAKGKVPRKRYINYGGMTDGELRLALLAEQLNIVGQFYGSSEHLEVEQAVIDKLQNGIARGSSSLPIKGDISRELSREIFKARGMKRPAAGVMLKKRNAQYGVGDPLIQLDDCDQYIIYDDRLDEMNLPAYTFTQEYADCMKRRNGIELLNAHLEESSHHLLYVFAGNNEPVTTVATKRVLHKIALDTLGEITELDASNMRLWLRNGVMRNNASQRNGEPIQPEDTIATLRSNGGAAVNGVFIALLPAIISAIAGAIGATVALINSIENRKRTQLQQAAVGIGTPAFGPDINDWYTGGNQQGGNPNTPITTNQDLLSDDNLPLILGGAAALLYFNS